jgi:hypothetical protein
MEQEIEDLKIKLNLHIEEATKIIDNPKTEHIEKVYYMGVRTEAQYTLDFLK